VRGGDIAIGPYSSFPEFAGVNALGGLDHMVEELDEREEEDERRVDVTKKGEDIKVGENARENTRQGET
jgi:uncharacterized protein with von Willebrand factor type A (vWA) domain